VFGEDVQVSRSAAGETAVARFVERFALLLTEAGMPRMPARVFTQILTIDSGKAAAAALADALRVSPAAISGAVRYLDQVGLIRKARDPGERRDHYEVTDDFWFEAIASRDKQMQSWMSVLADGVTAVGENTHAGRRLDESRRFVGFLLKEMDAMMERWREQQGQR
jgi:DNA-binding transcriptional regulator GbsR (MarR family)